jgi:4'-phosphopantetheinyl transferase
VKTTGLAAALHALPLRANVVHVWVLDSAAVEPACAAFATTLSSEEMLRAWSFRQEAHRQWFIARRGMLRHLLGGYLKCKPESICFGTTRFGKPTLARRGASGISFSVSQTSTMAVLAFSANCYLGVDVQQSIEGLSTARISAKVFSEDEQTALGATGTELTDRFYRIWTRKESLLKALGTGLSLSPKMYSTEDSAPCARASWRAIYAGSPLQGWTCVDLRIGREGHVWCALAASLPDAVISIHQCR